MRINTIHTALIVAGAIAVLASPLQGPMLICVSALLGLTLGSAIHHHARQDQQ